jgi:hypothetical protein
MAVTVTMLVSSLPEGYPHDERDIEYADAGGRTYTYQLHPSGALAVYQKSEGRNELHIMYGPSAWESVQGDGGTGR